MGETAYLARSMQDEDPQEAQMLWIALALAGDPHPMLGHQVQWIDAWSERAAPWYERLGATPYGGGAIPRTHWAELGVEPTGWWVLPADGGPAVAANVAEVLFQTPGECGGFVGIAVNLDGPEGLAALHGTPPEAWGHPVAPSPERVQQVDAWRAAHDRSEREGWDRQISYAIAGDVALVRVTDISERPASDESFGDAHETRDLRFDTTGVHEVARRSYDQYAPAQRIVALRDIDGDGSPDLVEGSCQRLLRSLDGSWTLASLMSVCCGC